MAQPVDMVDTGVKQGGKGRGYCTSAAGGRLPSVMRESLVSDGSCLPTTALPSMSKGKALPSPDAASEQTAPHRSHRARIEHQAVLQAISLLIFNSALPGAKGLGVLVGTPPRDAAMPGVLSSLGLQYLDPGAQVATLLLY